MEPKDALEPESRTAFLNPSVFPIGFKGVVKVPQPNLESELLHRVSCVERSLREGFMRIETKLSAAEETFSFFGDALAAHRRRKLSHSLREGQRSKLDRLHALFREDKELRHPHRKILDALISLYDYSTGAFPETHFSKLVRMAGVGKGAAKAYLRLLEEKGYVERRSDGYRLCFKISGHFLTEVYPKSGVRFKSSLKGFHFKRGGLIEDTGFG